MTDVLEVRGLRLAYGDTEVLRGIDLVVSHGESVVLLGPSGSGKTSLLYAIAGFLPLAAGEVRLGGRAVATAERQDPPERRDLAMVFQHAALWPHLTAAETVAYPMRRAGVPASDADAKALELLDRLGIAALARRRPAAMSGGEQQRVGIARAMARRARLWLLDEPTAHLDVPLRAALLAELAEQRVRSGAAALWATHDTAEALAVADRVGVLRDGRIAQLDPPQTLYERPLDAWIARLCGPVSEVGLEVLGGPGPAVPVVIGGRTTTVELAAAGALPPGRVRALVRPDWTELGGELEATVAARWYRGTATDYRLTTPAGIVELRRPGPPRAEVGEAVGWRLLRAWVPPGR